MGLWTEEEEAQVLKISHSWPYLDICRGIWRTQSWREKVNQSEEDWACVRALIMTDKMMKPRNEEDSFASALPFPLISHLQVSKIWRNILSSSTLYSCCCSLLFFSQVVQLEPLVPEMCSSNQRRHSNQGNLFFAFSYQLSLQIETSRMAVAAIKHCLTQRWTCRTGANYAACLFAPQSKLGR